MVCGVNGSTAPGASSGKLGTEVADAADETEGLVALRIDGEDPATRDLEIPGAPVSGWLANPQVPVPTTVKLPSGFTVVRSGPAAFTVTLSPVLGFVWVALPWGNAVNRRMVPSPSTHSMVRTKPVRWVWTRWSIRWRPGAAAELSGSSRVVADLGVDRAGPPCPTPPS
jgi:hypothetical protein